MPENIFVHIDLAGETHFVGRLWLHDRHGRETASFEYAREWKSTPVCFPLEPALIVGESAFCRYKNCIESGQCCKRMGQRSIPIWRR